jgi:hypothetical protein
MQRALVVSGEKRAVIRRQALWKRVHCVAALATLALVAVLWATPAMAHTLVGTAPGTIIDVNPDRILFYTESSGGSVCLLSSTATQERSRRFRACHRTLPWNTAS